MDGLPPIDVVKLKAQLQEDLDKCLAKVGASLDAAAPGRLLADSEEISRDALHEFAQAAYQRAAQQKVHAAEAAFSPSDGPRDGETL